MDNLRTETSGPSVMFVYSPDYEVDLGDHIFPASKYRLVQERLLSAGLAAPADFVAPAPPTRRDLELVHTADYLNDLLGCRWTERTRSSELPLTHQIARGAMLAAAGTILTAELALAGPVRHHVHIGGGFHHAFPDHAEGFCYINDIAVAIRVLQSEGKLHRAMVVDCDLHQGNGTARIFAGSPDVFTFSIHQERLYPRKEKSDLDIGLPDTAGDDEYLGALAGAFPDIARSHGPELVIYVAGADPFFDDQLGALRLSMNGLRRRDELVLGGAAALGIPTATVLAGGYARQVNDTVTIHTMTCQVARSLSGW